MMNNIEITGEYIKLEQALKLSGIAQTGGHAKIIVAGGEVGVNGETCLMRGKKLRLGDKISVGGEKFVICSAADNK